MATEVIITSRNPSWARSKSYRRTVTCVDLEHARRLARKVTAPRMLNGENINPVRKVTVWIDDNHAAVWVAGRGWGEVQEARRR